MDRDTSLYLDVVRPLAAILVFLSHISMVTGELDVFAPLGVKAVDVFFVLSGFVIAHVCATREDNWRIYLVSRAARIYSVALPAIIATFLLDKVGMHLSPDVYATHCQDFTAGPLLRSLSFLNEQWNTHRFPGSNSPYWSLGFEVWYYIAFGLLIFSPPKWRVPLATLSLVIVGPKVVMMFPCWLLGVVAYRACSANSRSGGVLPLLLFLSPIPLIIAGASLKTFTYIQPFMPLTLEGDRLLSLLEDYFIAAAFALNLIGFMKLSARYSSLLDRWKQSIRWIAGATFSIYLFHMPVMRFLVAISPFGIDSTETLLIAGLLTLPICFVFAEFSERRKESFRMAINTILDLPIRVLSWRAN